MLRFLWNLWAHLKRVEMSFIWMKNYGWPHRFCSLVYFFPLEIWAVPVFQLVKNASHLFPGNNLEWTKISLDKSVCQMLMFKRLGLIQWPNFWICQSLQKFKTHYVCHLADMFIQRVSRQKIQIVPLCLGCICWRFNLLLPAPSGPVLVWLNMMMWSSEIYNFLKKLFKTVSLMGMFSSCVRSYQRSRLLLLETRYETLNSLDLRMATSMLNT